MADKLNDIVYTDDSKETVDILNILLLGWILLGLIVYIIGNIIATQLRKRRKISLGKPIDDSTEATTSNFPKTHVPCAVETTIFKSEQCVSLQKEPEASVKPIIPICTGEDTEIVEWINNVFSWLYNQSVVSPVLESLLSALNARARLASTEHGILLDFKNVAQTPSAPNITNAYETSEVEGDVNVTCGIEVEEIMLDIEVTQFKENDRVVIPFTLVIKHLFGLIAVDCVPEDLLFTIRFSEPPVTEFSIEIKDNNKLSKEEEDSLKSLICEIATEASSSAVVNLKFSSYSDCPKLLQTPIFDTFESEEKDDTEKLLVKIIKATSLGGKDGCLKPYCVVEMDEPPQKFETREVEEKYNPFWDESFEFLVKDVSAELLFEIYDKGRPSSENFLGLGIVSVEELIKNPSQRQIIPLQAHPLEHDEITGSLTTEFLFLNQSTTPVTETTHFAQPQKLHDGKAIETNSSSRITAGGTLITTTTIKRTKEDGEADLTGTALKELEKHDKPSAPSKSTLIIHSVQRPDSSVSENLEASPASHASKESRTSFSGSVPSSPSQDRSYDERSRPKEKKSFIGNLRRKLSFRKPRSRSAENRVESSSTYSQESNRSASTERFRHSTGSKPSPYKSKKFIGMNFLAVPGSTRSSISEASGISTATNRTYINENSTLVIETNENGIIKRYLIPNSLIHRSKWKKRGLKLHIYNDHVFIAKHLSGSTTCQVCKKSLTRRPGKQGYECRGCNLQCHKSCHVKVAEFCQNSAINSMEVEFIQDPNNPTPKPS